MEAVECGAASLSMVLGYFGCFRPLSELRLQCGISRDGSKANNMLCAARHYGFKARGLTRSLKKLKQSKYPVILFWNFNHWVTLEGFSKDEVYINDPAIGHRLISIKEFKAAFTGVVLAIEPEEGFKKSGVKPSVFPFLLRAAMGYEKALLYLVTGSLLMVLLQLMLPAAAQIFIDSVLLDQRREGFRPLIVFLLGVFFLRVSVDSLTGLVRIRLQLVQMIDMNTRFLWRLLRLPVSFYGQRYPGEVVDRTKLNDSIASTVSGPLSEMAGHCITMLVLGLVLCFYDPWLTFIGLGLSLVNFALLFKFTADRKEANMSASMEMGKLQGIVIAGVHSMETIKASGQEINFFGKFGGSLAKAMNSMQKLQGSSMTLGLLPEISSQVIRLFIIFMGGMKVMNGQMSVGMLVAFSSMMTYFLAPLKAIFGFSTMIQELTGNIARVEDVMSNAPEKKSTAKIGLDPSGSPIIRLNGQLEMSNVQFGFNPNMPPMIQDFSLTVERGKSVALVGGSGSGKSTVAKIICGLYQPQSGTIRVDHTDLSNISTAVFKHTFGYVEQELGIFEGTIRNNLTMLDKTITDEKLIQAAKDAEIHDVILSMDKGYDAVLLENGRNLSVGQRQRLELARALVNCPSIVVMDEATSALDAEIEYRVMRNLKRRGCTRIIVAHRLSTIRDCDEIILLARGQIEERGTHDILISNNHLYTKLIKRSTEEEQA